MKKTIIFASLALLLLTVSACGGGSSASNQVTLRISNETTDVVVCYLYISPTTDTDWGDDVLGTDTTIPAGTTYDVQVDPGTYDLKAEDCNHEILATEQAVDLTSDQTWTLTDQ